MSITLDATLQTAQDGHSHRPIVELISSPAQAVIPFEGNSFNSESTSESNQDMVETSSGRLLNLYIKSGNLYLYYTDTDKTEWQSPVLIYNPSGTVLFASMCQLTSGSIGVVLVRTGYHLEYMIISETGAIETGATSIISSAAWLGRVDVIKLANDDYLMAYHQGSTVPPDLAGTYYLYHRTSSNFTSWGSATSITLAGLAAGHDTDGCNLLQITSGRIYLHFDYLNTYQNQVETRNLYHIYSDNNGSSWSSPVAITSHTAYGTRAINPSAQEKENGDIAIVWQLVENVIFYNDNMDGWPVGEPFYGGGMQYNEAEDNAYVRYWDEGTSPAFHSEWDDADKKPETVYPEGNMRKQSTCELIAHGTRAYDYIISIQDLIQNSITFYHEGPVNGDAYRDKGNFQVGHYSDLYLNWDWWGKIKPMIRNISESDRRIYMAMVDTRNGYRYIIGYIDADELPDPVTGQYEFHELIYQYSNEASGFRPGNSMGTQNAISLDSLYYIEELNYFMLCSQSSGQYGAGLVLINSDGVAVKKYNNVVNAGMPYLGISNPVYIAETNSIYFSFPYYSGQPDRRGIGQLDLDNDEVSYHEPNWWTCSDCGLTDLISMGDGRILMISQKGDCEGGGVAIFDTGSEEWTIYNKYTLPGMYCSGAGDHCDCFASSNGKLNIQYDSNNQKIFVSYVGESAEDSHCGVIVFSELGSFSKIQYSDVTNPNTTPIYSSPIDYSYYDFEYNPSLVIDTDNISWLTWHHMDSQTEDSLKWANTMASLEVQDYLYERSKLEIEWGVEKPNRIKASLSHGYLFDPLNLASLYSIYFKMGRILTLRLGEMVSDSEYWQKQGEFIVKKVSLSYGTEKYPIIKITAEDLRSPWNDTHIVTSEYFNGESPVTVTENLLVDHGGLESADYNIPTYNGVHNLYHQFVDMDLNEAIQIIMDHFGYFSFVNVDGEYEPRRINIAKSVDHTYPDNTKMVSYTPDLGYATFINRVTVKGMSNVYSEVLYDDEVVTRINGTVGHWGGHKTRTVWYADDHTRTCRYPWLEIIQSVSDFEIWGMDAGGGGEQLTGTDPNELYCVITIEVPDVSGWILGLLSAIIATGLWCKSCDEGWYCGACIFILTTMINILCLLLGAAANYNYNIWARPIGHERKSFQATANDLEFQQQMNGKIIEEVIDDPLCYTISSCRTVAEFEMSVVSAQRSRTKLEKTTHLQDEIGDKIRINHPHSGSAMDILITNLKRSVSFGKNASMIDDIEGWVLWHIDWNNRICKVKIQGSNEQLAAHFPQNEAIHPRYMRLGNVVKIMHKGGNRGYFEVIGHGMALPTPVSGTTHPPEAELTDGVISGCEVLASDTGPFNVEISDGTYRIDGTTYILSGENFGTFTMETADPMVMADPYAPAAMNEPASAYDVMTAVSPEIMNAVVPPMVLGTEGSYTLDAPPTGNELRYDCFYVGIDGVIKYLKGAAASSYPVKPTIPADTVLLGEYILLWTGMTEVFQSHMGMDYLAEYPTEVRISAITEFDWDEGDDTPETNIAATVYNQYGWIESGSYIMTLSMPMGSGLIYSGNDGWDGSSVEQQVSGSAYTFKYQRDQTELETSPSFMVSVTDAGNNFTLLNSHRIVLYDLYGIEVKGSNLPTQNERQTITSTAGEASIDWDNGHVAEIEMDEDVNFAFSISPEAHGLDKLILIVEQDSTGGWTPTFPASVKLGAEIIAVTVDETANKRSYLGFFYHPGSSSYDLVANVSGYPAV